MAQLRALKDAARAIWATGDYDAMMRQEGLYQVGEYIVDRVGVAAGEDVLDVACGTGNAAIPAARQGALVTGVDLTPELLVVAKNRADAAGVPVTWVAGDAEDLPFEDASFDVILSTFGCMFAPRHEVTADEIARVLRPGGRVGLCTWAAEGAIGDFFGVLGGYLPPLPEPAEPPLAWGDQAHVRDLFEGTGIDLEFTRELAEVRHSSVASAVDLYLTTFGPAMRAKALAEADGRGSALPEDLAGLCQRHRAPDGAGVCLPAEYVVISGRKRG